MRTATLILLFAIVPIFAAPQDRPKAKSEGAQNSAMPAGPAPRFEAIPASVTAGQATQLTWTVEGATSVNIQPVVGNVPASGSAPVTPGETTTYTLTAVLPSGNVTATTTVTVALTAPGATPPSAELPAPATTSPASMAVPPPSAATSTMPEAPKATAPAIDPTKMGAPRDGTNKPAAKVDDRAFILGAEDQIAITVYGSPEFSGSHMIRPDGKITLNFIGEVTATDLTPEQLGNEIKERIKKYIVDPDVSVQVLAVRSKKYFIQGEVGRTGEFPLTVPTRVLEALVIAGGFKDFAN